MVWMLGSVIEDTELYLNPRFFRQAQVICHAGVGYGQSDDAADKAHVSTMSVMRLRQGTVDVKVTNHAGNRTSRRLAYKLGDPRRPRDMRTGRPPHYRPQYIVEYT